MSGLADQLARQQEQQEQRQQALRVLFERPHMPPRLRTVVLLVPELVTRSGCSWDVWAQLVGVSLPTARGYLRDLERRGVLEAPTWAGAGGRPCDLRLVVLA